MVQLGKIRHLEDQAIPIFRKAINRFQNVGIRVIRDDHIAIPEGWVFRHGKNKLGVASFLER